MNKPTEYLVILLLAFAFIFGFTGLQGSLMNAYNANYTELSTINKSQEIYQTIEDQYETLNASMAQNPASGTNIFLSVPSTLLTTGTTIGYLFLSIPTWFQAVFNDLGNTIGIIPTYIITISMTIIFIGILGWFVYFWTGRKT